MCNERGLTATEFRILTILEELGGVFNLTQMAEACELSRRTLQRLVPKLVNRGLLRRESRTTYAMPTTQSGVTDCHTCPPIGGDNLSPLPPNGGDSLSPLPPIGGDNLSQLETGTVSALKTYNPGNPDNQGNQDKEKENIEKKKKISLSKPAKRNTSMPKGWQPTDNHRKLAAKLNVDMDECVPRFTDYHMARGSKFIDWNRAFNTWLRNAPKYNPELTPRTAATPIDPGFLAWQAKHHGATAQ